MVLSAFLINLFYISKAVLSAETLTENSILNVVLLTVIETLAFLLPMAVLANELNRKKWLFTNPGNITIAQRSML